MNSVLLRKGAEADIYVGEWRGRKVIVKRRIAKAYRNKQIDQTLRSSRTVREAKILSDAKLAGAAVPTVYAANAHDCEIVMEFIEGNRLRDALDDMPMTTQLSLARKIGQSVASLHSAGIVHGDVTTSNLIEAAGEVQMIDFGLSMYSTLVEDMGVDLLLAKRSISSTHSTRFPQLFSEVLEGYRKRLGTEAREVIAKMNEVERRGRYSERAG